MVEYTIPKSNTNVNGGILQFLLITVVGQYTIPLSKWWNTQSEAQV